MHEATVPLWLYKQGACGCVNITNLKLIFDKDNVRIRKVVNKRVVGPEIIFRTNQNELSHRFVTRDTAVLLK